MINQQKIDIELAKSWFIFAQLMIIFAGFLFASGGIIYGVTFDNFNKAMDTQLNSDNSSNQTLIEGTIQVYGDLANSNFKLYRLALISGFVFVIFGIALWMKGNKELKKLKEDFENGKTKD